MKQNSKSRFYVFCATALALLILVGAFASDVVNNMNLGLDLRGGFEIAYEVSPLDEEHELPEMSVVVASIRKRIDVLGVNEPVTEFLGKVIAIIHRLNDIEDKWVIAPEGRFFTKEEIANSVAFQEKFFDIEIMM